MGLRGLAVKGLRRTRLWRALMMIVWLKAERSGVTMSVGCSMCGGSECGDSGKLFRCFVSTAHAY